MSVYTIIDGTGAQTTIEADTAQEAYEQAQSLKHAPCRIIKKDKQ